MKRYLMALLWFVVIYVVLVIVVFVVPALIVARGLPAGAGPDEINQAATDFSLQHAAALSAARWAAFLIALALAMLGSWKGKLAGTRQTPAA